MTMDKFTLELVNQRKEAMDIAVSQIERGHESLKIALKLDRKLSDRCKEKGLDFLELIKQ